MYELSFWLMPWCSLKPTHFMMILVLGGIANELVPLLCSRPSTSVLEPNAWELGMNNVGHLWLSLLTSWPLSSREWAPTTIQAPATPNCCVHQHLEPINWWNKCIVKQNYIPSSDWLCLWCCCCSSAMLSGAPKRNPAAENGTSIIDVKSRLRLKKTEKSDWIWTEV